MRISSYLLKSFVLILSLATGWSFFYLSMPGSDFPLLVGVVLVPVLIASQKLSARKAGGFHWFFMTGCFLLAISWFVDSIVGFTGINRILAWGILVVFTAILALPYALVGYLIVRNSWLHKPFGMLFVAACYSSVVSVFPTSLPGNFAHSLYEYPILLQLLAVGGVPLILFVLVLWNVLLVKALMIFRRSPRVAVRAIFQNALIIGSVMVYGAWQLEEQQEAERSGDAFKVAYVQPKLHRGDSMLPLFAMSEQIIRQHSDIDLLVWPEIPSDFSYLDFPRHREEVNRLIARIDKPLIMVSGYEYEDRARLSDPLAPYYNPAHLIDTTGQLLANYRKQVLVPFFEYVPYEDELPFLRKLFSGTHRYLKGTNAKVFGVNSNLKVAPMICYETVFPELASDFVDQGANLFLNLSNDIWLGNTHGADYHFALGSLRAIEHRIPWVRVTNSGISGVVSSSGVIDDRSLTNIQTRTAGVLEFSIPKQRSMYSSLGDLILSVLVLMTLIGLFDKFWARDNRKVSNQKSSVS